MSAKTMLTAVSASLFMTAPANAAEIIWTDWIEGTANSAFGVLGDTDPIDVTLTSTGNFAFVQTGAPGQTNYWTEPNPASRPYTGGSVSNAPPAAEMVALFRGGVKTITFSAPISDLYIGLVSWNGNVVTFDRPFTKISEGQGFWGTGTFNNNSAGFSGTGEPHGILYFPGTFTSLSFTDVDENWHGLTVGIGSAAVPAIPEPSTWAMMLVGFGAIGSVLRRRRHVPAVA